jgi:hypothetical protein
MPTAPEHPDEPAADAAGRMEELDTPVKSSGDAFPRQYPPTDDEASDYEGTVRRKSKSKPKPLVNDDQDDDAPVRMKDMATLAILSRNNTVKPVRSSPSSSTVP